MLLKGKIALITGASRGIGRAIALSLAEQGAAIIATATSGNNLTELINQITAAKGQATAIPADLASEASITALVDQVTKQYGKLDILINNAGITHSGKIDDTPTADWDKVMAINARAPYILCRQCLPLLRQSDQAIIINISSVVGVKGYAEQTLYGSSKHALRGMSIALAQELRPENIRVHVICPGGVDTEMVTQVRPDIDKEELIKPEEIAELVLYLTTHKGRGIVDELRIRRTTSEPWF